MIKQVFIPLLVAEQAIGEMLELYLQSQGPKADDIFSGLTGTGLEPGIVKAKQLLQEFRLSTGVSTIYCANSQPPITNPESAALGLLLISLVGRASCNYQRLIVSANIADGPDFPLTDTGYWPQKLAAVLALGWQEYQVPLILSTKTTLTHDAIQQLKAVNIRPFQCGCVAEVLMVTCFGLSPTNQQLLQCS